MFGQTKKKGDILHFLMSVQYLGRLLKFIVQSGKQTKGRLTFHDTEEEKKERCVFAITAIWKEALTSVAKSNMLET